MANSKRKCPYCNKYNKVGDGVLINNRLYCNIECAVSNGKKNAPKAKAKIDKAERASLRERKKALKSRSEWLRDCQIVFNRWIRKRDEGNACISCGRNTGAKMNAGHYRSVGSCPELRFEELNVHLQCEHCNSFKSGNIGEYRPRLIEKIGLEKVEWIEGAHKPKKYTIDDLKEIIAKYKLKCKELE